MADKGLQVRMISFDCDDAAALAEFWSGVLGRRVDAGATYDYATIGFDADGPTWMFVHSQDLAEGRNRVMLDLAGEDDYQQQARRLEKLGARRIADHEAEVQAGQVRWVELHDPEGNTFRIFGPRPQ